jgi:HlyD family secretion protein
MDGEVLVVNYQPGDTISQSTTAVTLANRTHVRVEASVDESDIGKVAVGDPVTITVDALTDLALPGTVTWINPTGTTSSGLVKYTVRIDSNEANSLVLLGMSASVVIVTDTQTGALAVPLAAVLYDTQGEYVNRVKADGSLERVVVTSGQIQNGQVLVAGDLKDGDQVSLVSTSASTTTTTNTSIGGPGGLGGLTGGGPGGGGPQP